MTTYFLSLANPYGVPVEDDFEFTSIDCVLKEGEIGTLEIDLPSFFDPRDFPKDSQIRLYRQLPGQPRRLFGDAMWLVRGRSTSYPRLGERHTRLRCQHANTLLSRRYQIGAQGTSFTVKSGTIDDIMKDLVREHFTTASDTNRNWSSTIFTVDSDQSLGPSTTRILDNRPIYDILRDLTDAANESGTYLNFEVRDIAGVQTFLTYITHRGDDHRASSPVPILFGPRHSNVADVEVEYAWEETYNYVYAFGPGEGSNILTGSAQNSDDGLASSFGRIEFGADGKSDEYSAQNTLSALATSKLGAGASKPRSSGSTVDASGAVFGRDYDWGDLVTLETDEGQSDVRVDPVKISYAGGREDLTIRLTGDE